MPSRWNLPALHQFRGARGGQIISTNRWGRGAFRQDVVIACVGPTKLRVRFEELVAQRRPLTAEQRELLGIAPMSSHRTIIAD